MSKTEREQEKQEEQEEQEDKLKWQLQEEEKEDQEEAEDENEEAEEEEPVGYCARYSGKICRGYLSNPSSVWFNISNDQTGGWLNEQLAEGLWEEVIRNLGQPCQSAAKVTTIYSPSILTFSALFFFFFLSILLLLPLLLLFSFVFSIFHSFDSLLFNLDYIRLDFYFFI